MATTAETSDACEQGNEMRNDQLIEGYLRWLEPQLRDGRDNRGNKVYWDLLNLMFEKEFVVVNPMDENRAVDGCDLRVEFSREKRLRPNALEGLGSCSFLEVLIGLSRRVAFAAGGTAPGWAWTLLDNLELLRMSDPLSRFKARKANEIVDAVIHRNYMPDGTGGFFPLAWPDDDQTRVELWYQMHAYISELHPEH